MKRRPWYWRKRKLEQIKREEAFNAVFEQSLIAVLQEDEFPIDGCDREWLLTVGIIW